VSDGANPSLAKMLAMCFSTTQALRHRGFVRHVPDRERYAGIAGRVTSRGYRSSPGSKL
jgi:hypothetical protein